MHKWKYTTAPFDSSGVNFNELGREGWELVSVDKGVGYFKRLEHEAEKSNPTQRGLSFEEKARGKREAEIERLKEQIAERERRAKFLARAARD